MGQIKDFVGIAVGASLLGPVMGSIGTGFAALPALGSATQSVVGAGFIGSVVGKTKDKLKFL